MPRTFLAGALAAGFALCLACGPAATQDYPTRPITVIVPFAAGGPTDVVARIVADSMSKTLGQQLVIENVRSARAGPPLRPAPSAPRPTATPSRWATWGPTPPRSRSIRTSPTIR